LIAGDTNGQIDIFVHDRHRRRTDRASVATGGVEGNGGSGEAAISGGGRFIVFASSASNLTPNDSNGLQDIFIRDRELNVTERVNVATNGVQANGFSFHPSVSRNGRYVAFTSTATNLVSGDLNGKTDVFVRDRWNKTTTIVSLTASGVQGDDFSTDPAISADGKFVAFTSFATNFVASDNNGPEDIFVKDLALGQLIRVNIGPAGVESNGRSGEPSISGDGRLVSFSSNATNLVADDTNQRSDVFVHDRKNEVTFRVSSGRDGTQGDGNVGDSSMSADGRFVAFGSLATNLVPNDTNNAQDVFVYSLR
jgi:Tol biopolymer transport system component